MRIAVIGAGIVGVTTAYELVRDGHEVSVLERRSGVAAESSFAHAGLISPGFLVPSDPPSLADAAEPKRLRWFGSRGGQQAARPEAPYQRLHELARYSRERLRSLESSLQLEYEQQKGLLVLLRHKQALVNARPALKRLAEFGESFHLIDPARAREIEPGLDPEMPLHAAIHLPDDAVANGRLFAQLLKTEAQRLGARFLFDHEVVRLALGGAGQAPVRLESRTPAEAGEFDPGFDAVVVCAATGAAELLAPLRLRLPLAVSQGYSITAPLQMREHAFNDGPRAALFDASAQVSISRLGDRVRVSGGVESGGAADRTGGDRLAGDLKGADRMRPDPMNADLLAVLYKVLDEWFPGAAQAVRAQEWKGSRVSLPDGLPLLGASGQPGIWLNLAHGDHGWALACGSARLLADAVRAQAGGQSAPEGLAGLGMDRLAAPG